VVNATHSPLHELVSISVKHRCFSQSAPVSDDDFVMSFEALYWRLSQGLKAASYRDVCSWYVTVGAGAGHVGQLASSMGSVCVASSGAELAW
jgi:hypothetical protein